MLSIESNSIKETLDIGAVIGKIIPSSTTVCLNGDIGVGKTSLVKGIASALGIPSDEVVSPYFNILFEYTNDKSQTVLHHFDLMRLSKPDELDDLNIFEIIEGNGLVVIEWADKFDETNDAHSNIIPKNALFIYIKDVSETERIIEIKCKDKKLIRQLSDELKYLQVFRSDE